MSGAKNVPLEPNSKPTGGNASGIHVCTSRLHRMQFGEARNVLAEGDMDAAYLSALSALGGATIGGLASFGSSWLTQRTQLRFAHHEAIKAKREALYAEFIEEAARLYGDALGHQKDEVADLVKIYALTGRIRLVSPRPVVTAAERTLDRISRTYLAPNRTLHEVMEDFHRGGSDFFAEFGEACRQDLGLD